MSIQSNYKKAMQTCRRLATSEKRKKELYEAKEWYTIRAILGNQ